MRGLKTMEPRALLLPFVCAAMIANSSASNLQRRRPTADVCEREGVKLVGTKPLRVESKIRAPKKHRHVQPSLPELPAGTTGSGVWIGEALIDGGGKIRQVWAIREPKLTPPYPPFSQAIIDAIRQWEFEPLQVKRVPTPLCMTVVVNLHWE